MTTDTDTVRCRVLHFICSTGFYGAERWILALINNMELARGIDSQLAVTDENDVQDNTLATVLEQRDVKVHRLAMRSAFDPGVIRKLVKTLKEQRIDVLHTHGYKSDIIGLIAGKLAGVKCITTPHGFENTDDKKLRLYIAAGCRTYRFFDRVVPLSPDLVEQIKPYKVKPDRQLMIGNGVDLSEINFRLPSASKPRVLLHADEPCSRIIGFIGQMIHRKNIIDLLDVFDDVAGRLPGVKLALVGDGEDMPEFCRHASTLKHSASVQFLGFQSNALSYLQEFDLFAMTSSLEGVPRCLMESMASGVPVGCYSIAGVDQLVVDGKTGLSVEFGDKAGLADQWLRLLTDPKLADRLASDAVAHVRENFSAQKMADAYSRLYLELLSRG